MKLAFSFLIAALFLMPLNLFLSGVFCGLSIATFVAVAE